MTTIVTRAGKGSPLTHTEVDTNFTNLNTAKLEAGAIALGSAAAPSISFVSDTNTGIFSPGADQVAISTNGVARLSVAANGEVTFANSIDLPNVNTFIKGGGHNVIQVDATKTYFYGGTSGVQFRTADNLSALVDITNAGLVGIGTTSPGSALEINAAAATSPFIAKINTAEAARIDSSGRLLVGTSSARANFFNTAGSAPQQLQVEGTTGNTCSLSSICSVANTSGGRLLLAHQRSGAVGGNTILNSGDETGTISFQGNDGGEFVECASISAAVDGTPGANDMPGRLVFSTTADGAASPTEALRIKSTRIVNIANTPVHADNAAAKTAGLVDGDVYRKSDGTMMIVFT